MAKATFYFPHDYNSRNDENIQLLMMDCGASGYGIFWAISEILHEEEDHRIELSERFYKFLSKQMSTPVKQVMNIIETCVKYDLFINEENSIYSLRVEKNIGLRKDISENRSRAGKISAEKRALIKQNLTSDEQMLTGVEQVSTGVQQNPTNKRKEKEIKEKEIKGNKRKEKEIVFAPPEIFEVENYFEENGYSIESARKAHKYYSEANWIDSQGKKVKNWKQKMIAVWFKDENKKEKNSEKKENNVSSPSQKHRPDYSDLKKRAGETIAAAFSAGQSTGHSSQSDPNIWQNGNIDQ